MFTDNFVPDCAIILFWDLESQTYSSHIAFYHNLSATFWGDVGMVHAMDVKDRAKLADMDILEGVGLLGLASYVPQMKVCKYLIEELGLDVNAGGSRGGACFSCSRLVTAFLCYWFASMDCHTVM